MTKIEKNKPKIALWHHHLGIGDLIWHIPYMRKLAEYSKDGKIILITRPSTMPHALLEFEECIGDIIIYDHKPRVSEHRIGLHTGKKGEKIFIDMLRQYEIDDIYIFSNRVRHAHIAKKAGIKNRAGFGFNFLSRPPYLKRDVIPGSRVYRDATRLMMAHGFIDAPIVPKLNVCSDMVKEIKQEFVHLPKPWVCFSIGASEVEKRWGSDRFAQLASLIHQHYQGSVFLLGGKGEQKIATDILNHAGSAPYLHAILDKTIMQTAALLKSCDFLIGNDTGALNLAVAVDVPSLGLFGATLPLKHDPILYGIQADGQENIFVQDVMDKVQELFKP